jgi:hypothetical protein
MGWLALGLPVLRRVCVRGSVRGPLAARDVRGWRAMAATAASAPEVAKRRRVDTMAAGVQLTETEARICALLTRVVAERQLDTTLRIAGGWVRDKVRPSKYTAVYMSVYGTWCRLYACAFARVPTGPCAL